MGFFKKLFGNNNPENNYKPKITAVKIQHLFEYGKLKNVIGTGDESLKDKWKVGQSISWDSEGYYFKGYKDIPAQDVPPHIKWSNNPVFAYVAIVDNKVRYHYGEKSGSAVYICPVTEDPAHIKLIDEIFEHYYHNFFKLPQSLNEGKMAKKKADKTDKMKFLAEYMASADPGFFSNNFYDDDRIDNIAMWIDWREEDENIISSCGDILQIKQLSAETSAADNERGFETVIHYKNSKTLIPYKAAGADRDTTIQTLNLIIQPEFEIRLCKESFGSDTLCFLPLTKEQWLELEGKYSKQVEEKFEKITKETTMFN